MAFYHKYRPNTLDEVVGNRETVSMLKGILQKSDKPHAFLFCGPTGCGKTTLGRIVSKALGAVGSDFKEVDSADFRGIDTIRDIRKQSKYHPLEGQMKIWLIDECHKLTNDAQNAMLKMLEDAPKHTAYILATTDPQKLLPTVRGRCSQYQVGPLSEKEMLHLLRRITKAENENLPKVVYQQIIQDSQGLPRNAIQVLEQVLQVEKENRLDVAKRAAENQSQSIELCRVLIKGYGWAKVAKILRELKEQKEDPEQIRRVILGYCNSILMKESNIRAAQIMEEMVEPFYNTGFPGLTLACFSIVVGG